MKYILFLNPISAGFLAHLPDTIWLFILFFVLFVFVFSGLPFFSDLHEKIFQNNHQKVTSQEYQGPWVEFLSDLEKTDTLECRMYNFDLSNLPKSQDAMFITLLHKISAMNDIVKDVNHIEHQKGKYFSFSVVFNRGVDIATIKEELEQKITNHFSLLIPQSRIYFKT